MEPDQTPPREPVPAEFRAGFLFMDHKKYASAAGVFWEVVSREPRFFAAWVNLSGCLVHVGRERSDHQVITYARTCINRALQLKPENEIARKLSRGIDRELKKLSEAGREAEHDELTFEVIQPALGYDRFTWARDLASIKNARVRMGLVMFLPSIEGPATAELLLAALSDRDRDVKMAALKRCAPYVDRPELRDRLDQLASPAAREEVMPYIYMTFLTIADHHPDHASWALETAARLERETGFTLREPASAPAAKKSIWQKLGLRK